MRVSTCLFLCVGLMWIPLNGNHGSIHASEKSTDIWALSLRLHVSESKKTPYHNLNSNFALSRVQQLEFGEDHRSFYVGSILSPSARVAARHFILAFHSSKNFHKLLD